MVKNMPLSGVRSSVVVNGKWGDTEVNAGHRRQQTGLNWREPVSLSSPTTASRWRGSWRIGEEARKKEEATDTAKERHGAMRVNSERCIYCA